MEINILEFLSLGAMLIVGLYAYFQITREYAKHQNYQIVTVAKASVWLLLAVLLLLLGTNSAPKIELVQSSRVEIFLGHVERFLLLVISFSATWCLVIGAQSLWNEPKPEELKMLSDVERYLALTAIIVVGFLVVLFVYWFTHTTL